LTSDSARLAMFCVYIGFVMLLGGSSRFDVQSLPFLYMIACLFGAYALSQIRRENVANLGFPLIMLLAIMALMVVQLIPLPPSVWLALPQRDIVWDIGELMQIEQPWRPISFSPAGTLNSLSSMLVPLAAIFLYAILNDRHRKFLPVIFLVVAGISAFWALLQIIGPDRGPLYLYNVTNNGNAVGLFANRNHHGVFLACAILLSFWYIADNQMMKRPAPLNISLAFGLVIFLVPMIFVVGSRAGLGIALLALILGGMMVLRGWLDRSDGAAGDSRSKKVGGRQTSGNILSRNWMIIGAIGSLLLLIVFTILGSRSVAFDRLFEQDEIEGLRIKLLPVFQNMGMDFFPFGSGFGSFEYVYRIYEPFDFLEPRYLNLAHNDWAQWFIETGFVGLLILLAGLIWFGRVIGKLVKMKRGRRQNCYVALVLVVLIWLLASIVDYPLRTPSMMVFFTLICTQLADFTGNEPRQVE